MRSRLLVLAIVPACVFLTSCQSLPTDLQSRFQELWRGFRAPGSGDDAVGRRSDSAIYRSAHEARVDYLEREVQRLQADLRQAEEAMVSIESGLRGTHNKADAVSALAEARIGLERAGREAPWRAHRLAEARRKVDEAERQFQAGHSGSAIFFASRALRITETLEEEARRVAEAENARFIAAPRVNLRSGPSTRERVILTLEAETPVFAQRRKGEWWMVQTLEGPLGWVHESLLRSP
jgi:hypothetical protein